MLRRMNEAKSHTIVLASGGTGGHIFPAEALAEALRERGWRVELITDRRFENYGGALKNHPYHILRSSIVGGGFVKKLRGVVNLTLSYFQARALLAKIRPEAVVGFGGYPSFPTMLAAVHKKFPTVIHEQNSLLGRANYVLARKVNAIATSFPEVSGIEESDMPKVMLIGNPVRPAVKALRNMEYPRFTDAGVLKILVTGGSQGASVFGRVLPEALKLLSEEKRRRIRIDQQCRPADIEEVRKAYAEMGASADLATFFNDIPARLATSHLVIARAGASTIAELAVAGRPAVLVPYPHAKDDHQTANANALEDAGGGWLMPEEAFTPAALAAKLESFLALPDTLNEAAAKARSVGNPDADVKLAEVVERVIA